MLISKPRQVVKKMQYNYHPNLAFVLESFQKAGAQRHFFEILKGIHTFRKDITCKLFLIGTSSPEWSTFEIEAREQGISIIDAPYVFNRLPGSNLFSRGANWLSRRWLEKKLNKGFYAELSDFDAVICGSPFVYDLLIPNLNSNQRFCFHLLEHKAQRISSLTEKILRDKRVGLIFQHKSQVEQAGIELTPKSIIWPLQISSEFVKPERRVVNNSSPEIRLVHYSRVSPMRFIDKIIDAFSLLCTQASASLSIVGFVEDSLYHSSLIEQVSRLGISGRVTFSDDVKSIATDLACSSYDIVWMISISSHVGYASIESIAAGVPTLLLEVDPSCQGSSQDLELNHMISATPARLVERTLQLKANPGSFIDQQAQLLLGRYIINSKTIDELTAFYLGSR